MKQFLNFCFALCSIVLIALFFVPTVTKAGPLDGTEKSFKHSVDIQKETISIAVQLILRIDPGNLPNLIQVPDMHALYLGKLSNDKSMELDNLKLNAILFRDLEPDSTV